MKTLLACLMLTTTAVAADVDTSPVPAKAERVFRQLRFDRPILVTHANDGSDRIFVVEQKGQIRVFPNQPDVDEMETFLDIREQVVYKDKQNEEGLLGMAFHPNYKQNGEFFLYYTTSDAPHTSVVVRRKVSKDDPNKADPNFSEEIFRIKQPFWNHNGGTIVFGPDGYLYIALGDGGSANDPQGNGQNLNTLLGAILRIDINKKDDGKNYAIPASNPFVGRPNAKPEIFAYGLRNVWRMSFDPETKTFWAADVGQNLWEEINLIVPGGNYGWNVREALHPFPPESKSDASKYIDPIFEYHHDIGKSVTGGEVYRGSKIPELVGKYVYADYVSGLVWALDYDGGKKRVVGNHPIEAAKLPVMSFGVDQDGELYMTTSVNAIYKIVPAK